MEVCNSRFKKIVFMKFSERKLTDTLFWCIELQGTFRKKGSTV